MPKRLADEATTKIEIKLPVSLKRMAEEAARLEGDGDVSSWLRGLIRREARRLGLEKEPAKTRGKGGR